MKKLMPRGSPLTDRDWRNGRSGRALNLQRLEDQRKFVDALRRKLVQFQILQQMNPVNGKHDLMNLQGYLWVRIRIHLDWRRIRSDQENANKATQATIVVRIIPPYAYTARSKSRRSPIASLSTKGRNCIMRTAHRPRFTSIQ